MNQSSLNQKERWGMYIYICSLVQKGWHPDQLRLGLSIWQSGNKPIVLDRCFIIPQSCIRLSASFTRVQQEWVKALKLSHSVPVLFIHFTHKVCSWWRVSGEGLDNVLGLLQCRKVERQIHMQETPKHAAPAETHKLVYRESRTMGWLRSLRLNPVCLCSQWLVCAHIWFLRSPQL